jgi:arabinose-5-phosphate isomerase
VVQLAKRRGIVMVVDAAGKLEGVLTAGDLTRLMEHEDNVFPVPVTAVMNTQPKRATPDELASAVVYRMEQHGIMAMPVIDDAGRIAGVVHLHDLMRAGVT